MDVAIGLPDAVPGTTGKQLTEWARRAEARGFSSLGTIDRPPARQRRSADLWASGGTGPKTDTAADAGCDELIMFPSSSDPEQVDLLADAVGL